MHTTRHRLTPTHGVLPLTVSFYAMSCAAAAPAQALPRAVSDVAISVVTDPATSFVTGCASGAIIAGLLVSLVSRGTKKKLREQLAETMDALSRAEATTRAAEQMLHELQLEMGVLNGRPYSPFDYVGAVKLEDTEPFNSQTAGATGSAAVAASPEDPYVQARLDEDTQVYDTALENGFAASGGAAVPQTPQTSVETQAGARTGAPRAQAAQAQAARAQGVGSATSASQGTGQAQQARSSHGGATGASPAHTGAHLRVGAQAAQSTQSTRSQTRSHGSGRKIGLGATGQSVATRLAERYGRRGDAIVIERAPQVLEDTYPHARTVQAAPTMRYFDPKRRAEAINRRVPRLDESLYPDMTAITSHDLDPFATAMRAMDRAMGQQQTASYAPATTGTRTPAPRQAASGLGATRDLGTTRGDLIARATPMISAEDEDHVDQLIAEEFAINRSGAPRRYSRSKLTMIDGGEQASSSRRGGRHFANVS